MKFLVIILLFFCTLLSCSHMPKLSDPKTVALSYIEANIDADIKLLAYLESGDPKAFQSAFGPLSEPISSKINSNLRREKSDFEWKINELSESNTRRNLNVQIYIKTIDTTATSIRADEYLGKRVINGRMVYGEPIKPGLTFEEAVEMARTDPDIKPLEYNVTLTLEKISNGWIVVPLESKAFMRIFYPADKQFQEN